MTANGLRLTRDWTALPIVSPGAFRLSLAFLVIVSHISHVNVGRLAVMLFFVLSGYWISASWERHFDQRRVRAFWLARYARIAPLYLLAVVAAAVIRHQPLHLENFTLLGVASTGRDPLGIAWSLDVELQFYLMFPLLFWVARRLSAPLLLALIAIVTAGGLYLAETYTIVTMAKFLPAFALGMTLYAAPKQPSDRVANLSLLAFVAFTAFTALATPFLDKRNVYGLDDDIWAFVWMLPLAPYLARSLRVRSGKLDRALGDITFPLYLVHFVAIALIVHGASHVLAAKALAVAIASVVAVALYLGPDRWFEARRKALTGAKA